MEPLLTMLGFILLFLFWCYHLWNKRAMERQFNLDLIKNNMAWEEGRDQLEEMYQGMILTIQDDLSASKAAHAFTTAALAEANEELSVFVGIHNENDQLRAQLASEGVTAAYHRTHCLPSIDGK